MSIVAMGRNKISVVTEGIVKCLIKRIKSYRVIQKELMGMGRSVSVATIYRIKKGMTNPTLRVSTNQKTTKAKACKNATLRYIISPSMALVEKCRQRSLKLYRKLNGEKWKYVVTTDEALFYRGGSYGKRRVFYVRQPHFNLDNFKYMHL